MNDENKQMRRPRAIDVYAGVGGWALGLRLAGIDVVASYERSGSANETNSRNNHHPIHAVDVRTLELASLPSDIDIVVGSPPCTQFSFSNRGGGGDLADGMKDIAAFLAIVDFIRPRCWAMENVPRIAPIIEREVLPGGVLRRFRHLGLRTHLINMADHGLPQRRQRCVAGNFDIGLLEQYSKNAPRPTLGDIVAALSAKDFIEDPIFGIRIPRAALTDHLAELSLDDEEVRINRSLKIEHPVYNRMSFPDPLDKPVRTVTATCTRVSRESVVIEDPAKPGRYRRLTIRERACLQGFPVSFQFHAESYGTKMQLVGNAIPPAFTYLLGHALKETPAPQVVSIKEAAKDLPGPTDLAADTMVYNAGTRRAASRRFRFSIPSLRLPSGVRFELVNLFDGENIGWQVDFFFGTSKDILALELGQPLLDHMAVHSPAPVDEFIRTYAVDLSAYLMGIDVNGLQRVWSHRGVSAVTPFMLLDELDARGQSLIAALNSHEHATQRLVGEAVIWQFENAMQRRLPGLAKLARNSNLVLAGIVLGSVVNARLRHCDGAPKVALVA